MLFCMTGCKDDPYTPGGSSTGSNPPAYATFYYQANGLTVGFTANVPSDVYSCEWTFGDGMSDYGKQVSHTYSSAGTYHVTLTATSAGGTKTYFESITVKKNEPTYVVISSLVLRQFPATDPNDAFDSWDWLDDPDVYFKLVETYHGETLFTSGVKNNIDNNDLPVTYSVSCTLNNLSSGYRFDFYDEDGDADDAMFSATWYPSNENNNYGTSYDIVSNTNSYKFTLNLTWYSSKGEELYTKSADFADGKCLSDDPEVLQALGINK